jgi:ParB-like chromosome segregation protein Spo0J
MITAPEMIIAKIAPELDHLRMPIDSLRPHPQNPRRGNIDLIAASLEAHGQYRPIIARSDGEVLAGNHTLAAARSLGWAEIAALRLDLDDEQAKRILLVDNRSAELGRYDDQALLEILEEIAATEAGLGATGWADDDLASLEASLSAIAEEEASAEGSLSLAERFVVPPFSVLDARQGYWRDRRRSWLALGIRSEIGRGDNLLQFSETARQGSSGTSTFDPVLCEIAYRWFSPPAGRVLDPFAGGSVRGIVAAALGRSYLGIELRPEQIEANRAQAAEIIPRLRGSAEIAQPDRTPDLTPIEAHGGIRVKRDDSWALGGQPLGAKARTMWRLLTLGAYDGLLTAGAARSPQIERAALVAAALGLPARIHTADGNETDETQVCRAAGAELLRHRPGRLSVLRARLRSDAAEHPRWLLVPFGMAFEPYVADIAEQTANLPADAERLLVSVGSGATLAGILRGLAEQGRRIPILAVRVGADPAPALDELAPGWRDLPDLEWIDSPLAYEAAAPNLLGDLILDPMYEAKCLPFIRPGDVLWAVGLRASAAAQASPAAAEAPRWLEGDSLRLDSLLGSEEAPFDLIFSCPPYFDLERYSEDPADLSNLSWAAFLEAYRAIIASCAERLADHRFACWAIGDIRDERGLYRGLISETISAFAAAGMSLYNEMILVTPAGSLPIRVARHFPPGRKVGKTHQQFLVFVKGDPRLAAANCGPIEIEIPEPEEELPDA